MVMKDSNNPPLLELSLNPPPYHMDHMLSCMNPYGTQGHRVVSPNKRSYENLINIDNILMQLSFL